MKKRQYLKREEPSPLEVKQRMEVVNAFCVAFNVSWQDVMSHCRPWRIVLPRWCIAAALYEVLGTAPRSIATLMERDHSSVHDMRFRLRRELETNHKCRELYGRIKAELEAKLNPAREAYGEKLHK